MLQSVKVTIAADGRVEFDEDVDLDGPRRAILTFLDEATAYEPQTDEEEDAMIAQAQADVAGDVLGDEDFSHWKGYPGDREAK